MSIGHIVICLDDEVDASPPPSYVMAAHQFFAQKPDAEKFASSIAQARHPLIITIERPLRPVGFETGGTNESSNSS